MHLLERGLFGAVYIAIAICLLSKLGATAVIVFVVAGQLIGSIFFDHFGISGRRTSRRHQQINRLAFSRAVCKSLLLPTSSAASICILGINAAHNS
jgi:uncharacterized membrane protein YdcZ (DUF606 family)